MTDHTRYVNILENMFKKLSLIFIIVSLRSVFEILPDCDQEYKVEYQRQERDLFFHHHGSEAKLVDSDCVHEGSPKSMPNELY